MKFDSTAVSVYGLVITSETLELLVSKLSPEYDPEDYADAPYYFSEPIIDRLGISHIPGFTGEALPVVPDAREDMVYDWEEILFIPVQREVSPFRAAYKSFEEMSAEVSEGVSGLLPPDFDYVENIRHIVGTCDA